MLSKNTYFARLGCALVLICAVSSSALASASESAMSSASISWPAFSTMNTMNTIVSMKTPTMLLSKSSHVTSSWSRSIHGDTSVTVGEDIIEDTVNFHLYTPSRCVAAANRVYKVSTRAYVDPAEGDGALPTARPEVVKIATKCVARFDPNTVDERELIALAQAYISAGNSTLRDATFARKLGMARNTEERISFIRALSKTFFAIENLPFDESGPEIFLAQLDSINTAAARAAKVEIFADMAISYILVGKLDLAAVVRAVEGAIVAGKGLDSAKYPVAHNSYGTAVLVRNIMAMRTDTIDRPPVGTNAPKLLGDVVVGADRQLPVSGRTSLVIFQRSTSRSTVASIRKLYEEFGDKIDIIFVGKTQGHYKGQGPLTFDEEAKLLAEFYKTELQVPGYVILEPGPVMKRPDGRISYLPGENERAYSGVSVAIVSADGKFRKVYSEWMSFFEDNIREVLRKSVDN